MTDNHESTTPTTGRDYTRPLAGASGAEGDIATETYSPHPTDDRSTGTRDRQYGSSTGADRARGELESAGHVSETFTQPDQEWDRSPRTMSSHDSGRTAGWRMSGKDEGMLGKLQSRPLALVAAATVGGMVAGRMMRNRKSHDSQGYLRGIPERSYSPRFSQQSFPEYQRRPQYQPPRWNQEPATYRPAWDYQGSQQGYERSDWS